MLIFLCVIVGYTGPLSPTSLAAGRPALRATGWMIASIASFVLMTVAARQLTGRMSTFEILFLRSLVALAILLALRPRLGAGAFATHRLRLHVARNLVHFCGQYAWVWGIAITPLAVVTAIEFTTPVWAALLAALLLGERLSPPRWTAIASGVTGILVIAHPGTSAFGRGALIVLAGAFCFAASILVVKTLLRTDRVTAVVFYMSLMQLPLGSGRDAIRLGMAGAERPALHPRDRRDVADRALLDGARPVARRRQLCAAHRLPALAVHRPRRATALRRARRRMDDARRGAHLRRQLLERPRGNARAAPPRSSALPSSTGR